MNRRRLLALGGTSTFAGISGCIDGLQGAASEANGDDGSNETAFELAVEATDVEGEISLSADVLSHSTPDHYGELEVSIRNEATEPRTFDCFSGSVLPFHGEQFFQEEGDHSLWVRGGGNPERRDGCWVATGFIDDVCHLEAVEPGDTIDGTAGIFGDKTPRDDEAVPDPCLVPGTYSDEQRFELHETRPKPEVAGEYIGDASIELHLSVAEME